MSPWLRAFAAGMRFLTRLPLPGGASAGPEAFRATLPRALVLFPLVGGLIGAAAAAVLAVGAWIWPLPLAVLIALAAEAVLTGALHEDAVADVCDAFGGGRSREDVLRILRDPRIGSYGALGLGLAVALRAGGLMAAGSVARAAVALVVAGAVGRLAILALTALAPPDGNRPGLAAALAGHARWSTFSWGTVAASPALLLGLATAPSATLGGVFATGIAALWFARLVRRRVGGATGDCLGASAYGGIMLTTLAFAAGP